MAGLYIHIPFCRKLCYYCDFHFSVSQKLQPRMVLALEREITGRREELRGSSINSVYFGGGTPSVLSEKETEVLFKCISKNYKLEANAEISFETNPDDLSKEYLHFLKNNTPVNRLSIGVQSFNNKHLKFMNRRHDGAEARKCIERAKQAGFLNITLDLIYGVPGMSLNDWENDLDIFFSLDIPHLSAYHLTIEPKTVFGNYMKKGMLKPIDEELSLQHYELLLNKTEEHGFDNYEISNFARDEQYSQHNLGYWTGKPYLGFGPSAHSYIGDTRRWNIANNSIYVGAVENNSTKYFEQEFINTQTAFNEYLLTSLRTKWGINKEYLAKKFGRNITGQLLTDAKPFIEDISLVETADSLVLSRKGKFMADYIISALMQV